MPLNRLFARAIVAASAALFLPFTAAVAQEPGVDVAAPRFAISQVADAFTFMPSVLVVEQGDWVRWKSVAASLSHTTTSGSGCVTNNLWNVSLTPGAQFTRQFLETPATFPFFCIPHCGLGMTGSVRVTTVIAASASTTGSDIILTWTGGGGSYRIFRGPTAALTGTGVSVLSPDAGSAGTTFTDTTVPALGQTLFYYVGNLF